MDLVAIIAPYGAELMNRSPELEKIFHLLMVIQAGIRSILC